ncbi:MAG: adhesin [Desulfobacterium sp.]|nr:adhesin [Desulfobacterium sp.]MBU3949749.1 IscA/HesB family protein [Pseudomonadota bacterium]MBU4010447.1 IscA/HesB family protein [Pseudomonadota bacterium]MBU4035824.1 IscA/HesB family protein [Pseudomonadota bacterium]
MFTVTEKAQKEIKAFFQDKEIQPIRIFLNQSGCCGSQMVMSLDEKRDNDSTFKVDGIEYLIDRDLMKQAQPINVDYASKGFIVTSNLKFDSGCSSCGSGGSCG